MSSIKWIFLVVASSVTSSYTTYLFGTMGVDSQAPHNKEMAEISNSKIVYDKCEENSNLNKKNSENNLDKKVVDSNSSSKVDDVDVQLVYEQKQNEISSFRNFIEKSGEKTLAKIDDNYASEALNPDWSVPKEKEIQTFFESNEILRNSSSIELSCKSKNCRVIFSIQDQSQGQPLYEALKKEALKGGAENNKQVISYFSNPEKGEVHVYLSQNTARALFEQGPE